MKEIGFHGGIPIEGGAVPTYIQDQVSDIIDLKMTRFIDDILITQNTSLDDTLISISCNTAPIAGNMVCFKESAFFYQGRILTVTPTGGTGYDILLDTPLDYAYTTIGGCSLVSDIMSVDGSVSPVVFFVSPDGLLSPNSETDAQEWDITRILISMTDVTAMDDGKFGGITGGVANGIVIRVKNGHYKNIFNAKTNADLAIRAYDVTYIPDTLGPSGQYGLRMRRSFAGQDKNGVAIRLDGSTGDQIQLIVRDNLTELTGMSATVQGHVVVKETNWYESVTVLTEKTWIKVVDEKTLGSIYMRGNYFKDSRAYFAFVESGSPAPSVSPGQDGSTAVEIDGEYLPFNNPVPIDIYLWAPDSETVAIAYTK